MTTQSKTGDPAFDTLAGMFNDAVMICKTWEARCAQLREVLTAAQARIIELQQPAPLDMVALAHRVCGMTPAPDSEEEKMAATLERDDRFAME